MERVAYRQMEPGNPSSLVQVKEELPSPGSGEVLMRIRATSLNFRDVMMLSGRLPSPVKAGVVPLSDAAGEIIEVGPGTTHFSVGDRVINSFCATWIGGPLRNRPVPYATTIDGWLATHRVVPAEALSRMPAHLSFEEAATLPCAGVTAWSALSGIDAGDTVLTQGSGGVSLFAIQLASRSGARVIATTTSARKAERLKVLGAWEVIDVGASPEWAKAVKSLTQGAGADRIVEVGGPGTLAQSIRAVAYHGQVSVVGALTAGPDQPAIDFMELFLSQARYECIGVGSRADQEGLIRVMAQHQLRPVIDQAFVFDDFDKAYERLAGRDVFGKVVISH